MYRLIFLMFLQVLPASSILTGQTAIQTTGIPWPMPQKMETTAETRILSDRAFIFNVDMVPKGCDVVFDGADRYFDLIFYASRKSTSMQQASDFEFFSNLENAAPSKLLEEMVIKVAGECEDYPYLEMDERYELIIDSDSASLVSTSAWGILHGLETFSQLVWQSRDGQILINETQIQDYPRFPWRGVMLDTARHFVPLPTLKLSLDAMAYNKMNVFHWHIVDDQSFPYQSRTFPDLSAKGAYDPYTHVYSAADVTELVEYARVRGIRVVPEFDSPAHSHAWGKGMPDLLTKCYRSGQFTGNFGPIDPTRNSTFQFLSAFLKEITQVFPDRYVHLGGDEIPYDCWKSNPLVNAFMKKMRFGLNFKKLEGYYMKKIIDAAHSYKASAVVWQTVFQGGSVIANDTVVHVWLRGNHPTGLPQVTGSGHWAVLSANWYLNRISFGKDWPKFYLNDPTDFKGTAEQKKLVLGGEMCMWGVRGRHQRVISQLASGLCCG